MMSLIWPPESDTPPADGDQKKAAEVFHEQGKIIVEAPPGTGKTFLGVYLALCACRLDWVSKQHPALLLTFSRNARVQIEQETKRFRDANWISREEEQSIKVSNYHAFYFEILRKKAGLWGCTTTLRPASIEGRRERLEGLLKESGKGHPYQPTLSGFETPDLTSLSSSAFRIESSDLKKAKGQACLAFALRRFPLSDLLGLDETLLLDDETLHKILTDAAAALRNGRPHYDDFAPLFLNLLEHCPELVEWLRLVYPVVILDEFQDTDQIQLEILRRIHPEHLVILYDRYQMIYEWRGARSNRINQMRQEFDITDSAEAELSHIHRAGNQADLAQFIRELRTDELCGGAIAASRHHPWLTTRAVSKRVNQTNVPDETRCLTAIRCGHLINSNETTAILTRANYLANFLYSQLRLKKEAGAYYVCRWIGSEDNPDETIRDHVWRLRAVTDNPGLRAWLGELLDHLIPHQLLKDLRLSFSEEFARKEPLAGRKKGNLKAIRQSLALWWDTIDVGSYQAFARALREMPAIAELLLDKGGYLNPDAVYYVKELARLVDNCRESTGSRDWSGFCDHLEDGLVRSTYLRLRHPLKGLYILTVHQSKGREFDHIIIPWLSGKGEPWKDEYDGRRMSLKYDYGKFGDRRLLYVALTRARRCVTILYPEEDPSPILQKWKLVNL